MKLSVVSAHGFLYTSGRKIHHTMENMHAFALTNTLPRWIRLIYKRRTNISKSYLIWFYPLNHLLKYYEQLVSKGHVRIRIKLILQLLHNQNQRGEKRGFGKHFQLRKSNLLWEQGTFFHMFTRLANFTIEFFEIFRFFPFPRC